MALVFRLLHTTHGALPWTQARPRMVQLPGIKFLLSSPLQAFPERPVRLVLIIGLQCQGFPIALP